MRRPALIPALALFTWLLACSGSATTELDEPEATPEPSPAEPAPAPAPSSGTECSTEALLAALKASDMTQIGPKDTVSDPRCADGWAHAYIEWSSPTMDPAQALYQEKGGSWQLVNTGTDVLWDCSERELMGGDLPEKTCRKLLKGRRR